MSQPLPEDYTPGSPGHVEAHEQVNTRVNDLESAVADLAASSVNRTEVTDLQQDVRQALGIAFANSTGSFVNGRPDATRVLWVGRSSSDWSQAIVGDMRARVQDSNWP